MYSNLHFAITLLGIFSIFELLKGSQKISLIKYHFIARLILLTAGSFFDYLELAGYEIPYYQEIFKLIAAILFVNMLFLIVVKNLPKLVIGLEIFFTVYFIIQFINGFQLPLINDGVLQNKPNLYQIIFIGTYIFLVIFTIIYNGVQLFKQKNVVGGFTNTTYVWSSTEADDKTAYTLNFFSSTGTVQAEAKNLNPRSVRAIRSF